MDQPKLFMSTCFGSSSAATLSSNPLNEAVLGLEAKLSQVREVLKRAGWNGWMQREEDEIWSWLESLTRLEEETRVELEKWKLEIHEVPLPAPVAVKVLYSIPCVRSCIKRDIVHDSILLKIVKGLSEKIELGFKDDDVSKFDKLAYPDSESADRCKPPLSTSEVKVLPVRGQVSDKDSLLKHLFPISKVKKLPVRGQKSDKHLVDDDDDEDDDDDDDDDDKDRHRYPKRFHHDKFLHIISIYGSEGSGKTTLAQMVYNDERVGEHFQVRKWLCMAGSFASTINRVRRELVEGKGNANIGDNDVQKFLCDVKFLLVFDDVRDWGNPFPDGKQTIFDRSFCRSLLDKGAPGSMILVTTRDERLDIDDDYMLRKHKVSKLSTSDCWSIIKQAALLENPQLHWKVRDFGRKFAEKCEGYPLLAKIVGDYLKSKLTAKEWEDALGDETWKMKLIGVLSRIRYPLSFSNYERLFPALKRCFASCVVFPKDANINVERLAALWAAMGYISDTAHRSVEDEGEFMVYYLSRHSFIHGEVTKSIHKDKITSCKMHEAYYPVACSISPELTVIEQMKKLYYEAQTLKSFVIVSHCEFPKDLFWRLKYVCALVLSCCKLEQLSEEVGTLDLLKFLDLSGNPLKRLPEAIGDLNCLESLHLHSCYLLLSLPQRIGDLHCLRNLRISRTTDQLHNLPQGFEKLTSVRTLDVFRVGGAYDNIEKLKSLNELLDIRIAFHGVVLFPERLSISMESKSKLENLELCFVDKGRDQEMAPCIEKLVPPANLKMLLIEDYHGLKLPRWILTESLINKLKRLSLRTNVNINSLPALWKLSSLEFLWLYDMPKLTRLGCEFFGLPKIKKLQQQDSDPQMSRYDDEEKETGYYSDDMVVHSAVNREITKKGSGVREESKASFSSLMTLRIEYLENLEIWEDADEHYDRQIKVMPCLLELIIDCPKLQGRRPLRILRDTPWFEFRHLLLREGYYRDKILAVDVGVKHDSNVQKLKEHDHQRYIRINIHGRVHFKGVDLNGTVILELCFVGDGLKQEIAQCIEELEPPPNLDGLKIDDYPRFRLPNWIFSVSSLYTLSVRSSPNISSFPDLWKLPCLQYLWLFDIPSMKCLGLEFFGFYKTDQPEKIRGDKTRFPYLETLKIEYLPNWETWEDIDAVRADKKEARVMPQLQDLIIVDCPKLQGMPLNALRDTPWFKGTYKSSTSTRESNEVQIEQRVDDQMACMNDKNNDEPSTSTSKGKANLMEEVD